MKKLLFLTLITTTAAQGMEKSDFCDCNELQESTVILIH